MSVEEEIASWAATRPAWQQTVLHQLGQGHLFNECEIEAIAAQMKAGTPSTGPRLKPGDVPGMKTTGATVLLRSIRDATNVNALVGSQELTFPAGGLTVVYGDNGSGKSGYAQLIKEVAGARHHQPVHQDVFADSIGRAQKAEIGFACDSQDKTSIWPDAVSPELRAIGFYDEVCGDAYIGGESELTYRPPTLGMLDGLITLCDAVRDVLDGDLRNNQAVVPSSPDLPGDVSERTPAGPPQRRGRSSWACLR